MKIFSILLCALSVMPLYGSGDQSKTDGTWCAISTTIQSQLRIHEQSSLDGKTIRFVCSYAVLGENLSRYAQRTGQVMEMTEAMCFNAPDFMKVFTKRQVEIPIAGCFVNLGKSGRSHSLLSFEVDLTSLMSCRKVFICIDPPGEHTSLVVFQIKTKTIQKYLKQAGKSA